MSEGGGQKRKSKAWYRKQAYHNKRMKTDQKQGHRLTVGLKGFIVTCNDRERDAVKETYNILNEYADKLYGPETKAEAEDSGDSDGDDIEAAIAKEVQELKEAATKGERRFQNSQTGAKNCIFIKTTLEDPVGLAHAIFTDLRQSKQQKSRHALRLLPVVGTCKANVKEINELAKDALQPFFTDTKHEVTFTITFKARNNNGIGREMVISTLRETIVDTFSSVLVKFTHVDPQITILVEVMCGVACIAVAKDFAAFRKYNLVEVVHDKPVVSNNGAQSENATKKEDADTEVVDNPETQQENMNATNCDQSGNVSEENSKLTTAATEKTSEDSDVKPTDVEEASPDGQSIPAEAAETSQAPDADMSVQQGGVSVVSSDGKPQMSVETGSECSQSEVAESTVSSEGEFPSALKQETDLQS